MKANKAKSKFVYPDKLYARCKDNKTLDISYAPQNMDAVEYTRTDAFIEEARKWFIEHTNISQEIETNEDGEPLADSYVKYAKARLDAANEIFENFKTYIEGE